MNVFLHSQLMIPFFFLLLPLLNVYSNVGSDKDMFTSVANQPAGLQTYSY